MISTTQLRKLDEHEHDIKKMMSNRKYQDTYVKLARHRMLFISEDITDQVASELSALLLHLDNTNHQELIEIYLHTAGGAFNGLINIYDVMQLIQAPIRTVCIGKCYSAGAIILAAGTKGQRFAFPNASIMIHGIQAIFPIPGHDLTASKSHYSFLDKNNNQIIQILADHTGHSVEQVKRDCLQNTWMTPEQACDYGIIDHILV